MRAPETYAPAPPNSRPMGDPEAEVLAPGTRHAVADDPHRAERLGTILRRSELKTLPKVEPLITGLLSSPSTAVLVGGYSLGKSVLAHALACSVALGRPWLGREVQRRRVLVVVGEGASGLDDRITAWERAYCDGAAVPDDWLTFQVKPGSLNNDLTWAAVSEFAVTGGYGFVIFDTFSSLAPDADETKDAARMMRRLSDLSTAIGGTALLVHHPGWSDAGRTRGGYQFEANADEVLVMTAVGEGSTLVCVTRKKVKDGTSGGSMWLNRRACFGSVVFEHARADDAEVPLKTRILTVLRNYGDVGATGKQVKDELGIPDNSGSAFFKALRKLADDGDVRAEGARGRQRYYLAADQADPDAAFREGLEAIRREPW